MPNSFSMDASFVKWVTDGILEATEEEIGTAEFHSVEGSEGMYVRLTALGTVDSEADESDPAPYKANSITFDKDTGKFSDADPIIKFDADDTSGDLNIVVQDVYALNGAKDLTDSIQWISLHTYKVGTGDTFWGFVDSAVSVELAVLTGENPPGIYTAPPGAVVPAAGSATALRQ